MVGCILWQLKPSEFYTLSSEIGRGLFHNKECITPRTLSCTWFFCLAASAIRICHPDFSEFQ